MMLLERAKANTKAVATAGTIALSEARVSGAPVYYVDHELGDILVKELPDGSRFEVEIVEGRETVVRARKPRR